MLHMSFRIALGMLLILETSPTDLFSQFLGVFL